jgi:hypothetical protein
VADLSLRMLPGCGGRQRFVALAALFAAGTGCADGEALSVDRVLDSMESAVASGRSRNAIQSLTATAECTGPDGAFETTVTSIRPDTVYFRRASARGITEIWSTAERTWGGTAGEEYESLTPQVRDFVRGHEFHLMVIDVKDRFSDFELVGPEKAEDADCLRISMKDEAGADASVCVRTDNWLPAEMQLNPDGSAGPVRIVFDDWRVSDGLNLFHAIELTEDPDLVFSYEYVDISVNTFAAEMRVPPPNLPRVQRGARE